MKSGIFNLLLLCCLLAAGCSSGNEVKIVKFEGPFAEKKWAVIELNPILPADWSLFNFLTFEINSSTTQRFELRLYDAGGIRKLEILPFQNVWIRASVPLIHFQEMNTDGMDQASIWKTPRTGYWIGFTGTIGPITHVDSLSVAMLMPIGSPELQIRNFRLTMTAQDSVLTSKPVVDEFGQWIPAEWTGKAKTIGDLKAAWLEEERALKTQNSEISQYGGFENTRAKATGFFHVEKIDNRWWFVDPKGCLFYSNGSNCIEPGTDVARIEGRKYLFTSLPPDAGKNSHGNLHRGENISSFYTWNLSRRFGNDWYQKWIDLTFLRMNNWGINTIGNWSDPNLGSGHRKAYVATLEGWGIETGKDGDA